MQKLLLLAWICFTFQATAADQELLRLKLDSGETLKYRVLHTTDIKETTLDEESKKPVEVTKSTKLQMIKSWTVKQIDSKGLITLDLTIHRMRLEQKLPDGKSDLFDSEQPDELNKEAIAQTVGPVLATIKINDRGDVVEVVKSPGPKHRALAELPFKVMFAEGDAKNWQRACTIQIDPPQGLGDRYGLLQSFSNEGISKDGLARLTLKTALKETLQEDSEKAPLLPFLWEGFAKVSQTNGRIIEVDFNIGQAIKNHQGNGSSYRYDATYKEELLSK
jgi:hypothetical protein